ncbi:hypothetical protein [Actinoplanes sp. GCM10030250]|uniref:hypothetical protein n=1 Tax=Actinoplanes sp. GCM10030250 TaxID=3273376 RepID=UPI00361B8D46
MSSQLALSIEPWAPGAQSLLYLVVAAGCLLLSLSLIKTVLVPMGALLRAAAAVAVVALALLTALLLVVAALIGGLR